MAKNTSGLAPTKGASLSHAELVKGTIKIQRRIEDLRGFNATSVMMRSDASVSAITAKVNGTLRDVLGGESLEYQAFHIDLDTLPLFMGGGFTATDVQTNLRQNLAGSITKLCTLIDMLNEKMEDAEPDVLPSGHAVKQSTRRVFVVHGHDDGLKETVARYLGKLSLDPIILHEKANEGRTIIEKFEAHAEVDFAVVLFTPDDVGFPTGKKDEAKSRPRQNVILELGFFIGRLGRRNVCVLHKGDMEMLSDIAGVLYVPVDPSGNWQLLLAKELKTAGLEIDMNKLA
jgi:predicted nucleotide-binding protein